MWKLAGEQQQPQIGKNLKKKKKKRKLLVEPSVEEERQAEELAPKNCISLSEAYGRVNVITGDSARLKIPNKGRLGPLLSLLFASILFLAATSLNLSPLEFVHSQTLPTLANSTTNSAFLEGPSQTNSSILSISSTLNISSLTTAAPRIEESDITAPSHNSGETSDDVTLASTTTVAGADEQPEPEVEDLASSDSPSEGLSPKVVVGASEDAAELLIGRMKESHEVDEEEDVDLERRSTLGETPDRSNKTEADRELELALETYARWRATSDDLIELFSRKMLPLIVEHGYDVDPVTVTGLLQVFNGIRAIKAWALKLLDASAKLQPGLLLATQSDFGDFDECLGIREDDPSGLATLESLQDLNPETGLPASALVGRYCIADLEFPKPPRRRLAQRNEQLQSDFEPIELRRPLYNFSQNELFKDTIFVETANFFHMLYVDPLRVGVCLTNKIEPESFERVFNKLFENFRVSIHFRGRCTTKWERPRWSQQQVVSFWILLVACSLVILCTSLDLLHTKLNKLPLPKNCDKAKLRLKHNLNKWRPLFTSFSIIRNTKRLFKPQASKITQNSNLQAPSPQIASQLAPQQVLDSPLISERSHQSCSESEPSPSIERRSSLASSGVNLIKQGDKNGTKLDLGQFTTAGSYVDTTDQVNLLPLHGIRVITMTWMIVNHTYLFGGFFVLWAHRRLIDIAEWPKSISFQLVLNGWLTVETYFFLSAMIIVLNLMPLMKSRKFAYLSYILHRLIRLLPAYVGLVCLNFLWPLISNGPVWLVKGQQFIQTPCENYLWANFLFINNWIWPEKQCMVHTWFLSADFQLYLLAPIIVYTLYRRPVFGHSLNIIVALVASCLSGLVIYANKLMPTTLINKLEFDSIKQQLSYSYMATYQHMGPYCLGLFIGYLLHKRPQMRLPKHLTWLLWLLLPPLSFTTLLLTYLWNGAYQDPQLINPSPLVSALYVAIHRTIWSSLLAWIVFATATGRAKLIAQFLSHSVFIPLSRLSFSIYLVHLPVIMFRALNLRHTIEWTDSNILWEACGNFIASTIVGYFVNVVFESPIINLEQAIFGRKLGAGRRLDLSPDSGENIDPIQNSAQVINSSSGSGKNDKLVDTNLSNLADSDLDLSSNSSPRQAPAYRFEQYRKLSDDSTLAPTTTQATDTSLSSQDIVSSNSFENKKNLPSQPSELCQDVAEEVAPPGELERSRFFGGDNLEERQQNLYPFTVPTAPNDHRRLMKGSMRHQATTRASLVARESRRAPQYLTLARTSQFNHNDSRMTTNLEQQELKSRSQLGGLISQTTGIDRFRKNLNQHQQPSDRTSFVANAHLERQRRLELLNKSRQGRYNTLTAIGKNEWRRYQMSNLDNAHDKWHYANRLQPQGNQDQPILGQLIPRIDSSTLRRNNQNRQTDRIVEESQAFEERSEI